MGKVSREVATIITANTRFPPSRRPPRPRTAAEKQHIRHIGEIVHAWNHAHGVLFHVFSVVVAGDDISLAHALWHSIQSDKGQRTMLSAVVRDKYPKTNNSIRRAILWAVSALDLLGTHRNDAAHVEVIAGHPDIIPGMSTKTASLERLEKSPVAMHWRIMRGDLYAIMNYLDAVYLALWNGWPRPLSRKPKLLFARTATAKSQARRHRAKKARSESQRQSSQA